VGVLITQKGMGGIFATHCRRSIKNYRSHSA
jgi:hypothetical protein